MKQGQFLEVVTDTEAHRILLEVFHGLATGGEEIPLENALGRVLASALRSRADVPGFDRSNMDGFALRAADSFGSTETDPRRLQVWDDAAIAAGSQPHRERELEPGVAIEIATGGALPRGADAVVMIEDTAPSGDGAGIEVFRAVTPGTNISGAGSDVGRGDIVLQAGVRLTSRETALAAAVGVDSLPVARQPRALVLSTGDEVRPPGSELALGEVFDSNGRILMDALHEAGALPTFGGILPDDEERLHAVLSAALDAEEPPDLILMSGGTSKGRGDLNAHVLRRLAEERPDSNGIVLHGVALKPGKPICVAEIAGRPVFVLPGFPTSAIFTFHEFVGPLLRRMTGEVAAHECNVQAVMPVRVRSMAGRTEYLLVDLVPGVAGLAAYPLGAGSGSVSTFSRADGYVRVPRNREYLEAGELVDVRGIGRQAGPADLLAIGSHCVGLELLLGRLSRLGFRCKSVAVGSLGGLQALARGEGDVAGSHLLDAATDTYNRAFLPPGTASIGGYVRRQGIVFRAGDSRFEDLSLEQLTRVVRSDSCRMVNRNRGSGTRLLLDRLLGEARPPGHMSEAKSHHGVAAAVAQERADWGMTLDVLARDHGLGFCFVRDERFELVVPEGKRARPAVAALIQLLGESEVQGELAALGFRVLDT